MTQNKVKRTTVHLSVRIEDAERLERLSEMSQLNLSVTAALAFKLLEQAFTLQEPLGVVLALLPRETSEVKKD